MKIVKKTPLSIALVLSVLLTNLSAQTPALNTRLRSFLPFTGGQTGANLSGFAQNGREYALEGASKGLLIVDVTNPDLPRVIRQIPSVNSLWHEVKTYRKYAYVVILIVAAVITPSPDWTSQTIVAVPLILLYEISIFISKRVDRLKVKAEAEWD